MEFKAQIIEDLKVFHNPGEFGEITNIWYHGSKYTLPIVIDHEAKMDRKTTIDDHGEGINQVEAKIYFSLADLGFVPQKGAVIEIEEAGAVNMYAITKADHEAGEVILELGAFEE